MRHVATLALLLGAALLLTGYAVGEHPTNAKAAFAGDPVYKVEIHPGHPVIESRSMPGLPEGHPPILPEGHPPIYSQGIPGLPDGHPVCPYAFGGSEGGMNSMGDDEVRAREPLSI